MRQLSTKLLILIMFLSFVKPVQAAVTGKIEYSIPIDYSKLSAHELEIKAHEYFYLASKYKDVEISDDMTNALNLYLILQHVNPDNPSYCVKQGILYDKLKKDRQAKGCFSRAISVDKNYTEAYFEFGNFYYKRESYRKALQYYIQAYRLGYDTNYDLLEKMGDIYEKLGDTHSALKYLKLASEQNPNDKLTNQINRLEANDAVNYTFYENTRIHKP